MTPGLEEKLRALGMRPGAGRPIARQALILRALLREHPPWQTLPNPSGPWRHVCGTCTDPLGRRVAYPCRTVVMVADLCGWEPRSDVNLTVDASN